MVNSRNGLHSQALVNALRLYINQIVNALRLYINQRDNQGARVLHNQACLQRDGEGKLSLLAEIL